MFSEHGFAIRLLTSVWGCAVPLGLLIICVFDTTDHALTDINAFDCFSLTNVYVVVEALRILYLSYFMRSYGSTKL